jgi:hypothetical protein
MAKEPVCRMSVDERLAKIQVHLIRIRRSISALPTA